MGKKNSNFVGNIQQPKSVGQDKKKGEVVLENLLSQRKR